MIGTSGEGHVYPGVAVPFGFVQISPDTASSPTDWCSGYDYSARELLGFSLNHLTGTGCPDLGNFHFLPLVGNLNLIIRDLRQRPLTERFSHGQEETHPGYYSVFLADSKVEVELTATCREGVQRYTFPETADAHVLLDLRHGVGNHATDAGLAIENDRTITGFRKEIADSCFSPAGVKEYCFVAEFSRPFASFTILSGGDTIPGTQARGTNIKAFANYRISRGEKLVVRVGLSTVSVEGARKNLRAEVNTWDCDKIVEAAKNKWLQALGKIRIETESADIKTTFYTALYHTQLTPIVLNDVDGQFRGPDNQVHQAKGFEYYTDLSLWDTFRAAQPLLTLLQPERVNDIVNTMIMHYSLLGEQMLPLCAYSGHETYCMIGNPSIPVISEAYAKGLRNWDGKAALSAMIGASEREDEAHACSEGLGFYRSQGWIPSRPRAGGSLVPQSVSKTLEFAYDDACLARFARSVGRDDIGELYARRSTNWMNIFDASSGFMRGRNPDGRWVAPFDPKRVNFSDYTEANAWQYNFFVPHDVSGLIRALGGDEKFVAKLDELFDTKGTLTDNSIGLTGLIGMYCQGNEPCHNFAYLYNYAGQPWKTQVRVRQIAATFYKSSPDGLCGNDDCGQMSAWYVFTALGFYPVDPPSGVYVIGSPLVDRAIIKVENEHGSERSFMVLARNNSAQNVYIQSATLNGRALTRSWIAHSEIVKGGTLILDMGAVPNQKWGAAVADRPAQALVP